MIRRLPLLAVAAAALPLGGCDLVVMNPSGDVARGQADLILWSTFLMLLIIIPVIILTILFAWRYRAKNEEAEYRPDWDHSTGLELIIWAAPLLIVIALGALTWVSTHLLDPYRPLARLAPGKPVGAQKPLEIQVVSLDWKWLFIYPEQGIATVNELVVPVDRQVRFRLTSAAVMNAFYVPAMAGMIYTMPGMETKLHAVLNRPGKFEGMSSNYSGAGFTHMHFWTYAVDDPGFARFVSEAKAAPARLTRASYLQLEKPSEKVPPMRIGGVDPDLFRRIAEMCVAPNTVCMSETMRHDAEAAAGRPPVNDVPPEPGKPDGALLKPTDRKGESPHMSSPDAPKDGRDQPGDDAHPHTSFLDRARLNGEAVAAQG